MIKRLMKIVVSGDGCVVKWKLSNMLHRPHIVRSGPEQLRYKMSMSLLSGDRELVRAVYHTLRLGASGCQ